MRSDPFAAILRAAILVLGIWSIYAQVSVLLGRTFDQLLTGAWSPAAAILLFTFTQKTKQRQALISERQTQAAFPPAGFVVFLGVVSSAPLLLFRPGSWIAAAIYTGGTLFILARMGDAFNKDTAPIEGAHQRQQTIIVLIVIVAAMIVTLCEHRVNWDDAKYLHNVANALEFPDEPMVLYEHLHGVKELKIYHPSVRLQTYELTVAAISKVLGVSHLKVYYLILPPIWAALAVIAQWVLIRRLAGRHSAVALIGTFVLLCVWGGHRSYGAFSFDYVGRGVFLSFAVPALVFTALKFADKANYQTWLSLFLTTWTGCLLTSTAYAVAPMTICLVLIASYGLTIAKARDFVFGVLAFVWCPLVLAYVTWVNPIVMPLDVDSAGGAHFVFRETQGKIALALFGIAPFLLLITRHQNARWLLRYNALSCLILLSGFLLTWVGKHSSILSWRLLWAIPVPVIIGVGISSGIEVLQQRIKIQRLQKIMPVFGLAIIAIAFSSTGNTVLFRNFGWPVLKMDKSTFPVARALVQCSKATDLVLAPPEIGVPMAGLLGAPSLVGVRGHHLSYLSAQWGVEESERRKRLFNMAQGERHSPADILWARDQLHSGSINRIVLKRNSKELEPMKEMLQSLQMEYITLERWEVWLPKTSKEEAINLRSCLDRSERKTN